MTADDRVPPAPRQARVLLYSAAMKRALANLALLAATLAASWLLLDRAAARLLDRPRPAFPKTHFSDPRLVANSFGRRDYEYPEEKPAGVFRILAVGDSFTQGGGVAFDDIYPKRLERSLNVYESGRGVRFQVLNWGRPGSSTPSQAALVRERARAFGADLVVVGYCLNDAEDESDRPALQKIRSRTVLLEFEKGGGLAGFLYDNSALVRLVRQRLFQTRRNRGHLEYYREVYADAYPGWRKTAAAIADLGRFRTESGVPVLVMIYPLFSWELDDRYPFRDVHERIHRELERAGLPYLDLLPFYRGLDHTVLEAVPFEDPHPSDVAHRIAAEELYLALEERGLLPGGVGTGPRKAGKRRVPPPWGPPG